MGIAIGLTGCSKGGGNIDTSKVQSAFQNAPPVDKAEAQNALNALKAHDYPNAFASLKKVVSSENITPEQRSAIQDLMNQIQSKGLGMGEKAMGGLGELTNQIERGASKATEGLRSTNQP